MQLFIAVGYTIFIKRCDFIIIFIPLQQCLFNFFNLLESLAIFWSIKKYVGGIGGLQGGNPITANCYNVGNVIR